VPVPTCDGVNPLFYVRWYQFEGDGKEVTILTDAMDTYIAISVFTGGCDLECVAADGPAEVTDTTAGVAFETEEDAIYLVAVTTTWKKRQTGLEETGLQNAVLFGWECIQPRLKVHK
jgi:predicted choloylglycine hydrolase